MTLTLSDDTAENGTAERCECVHPMSWGLEPCDEPATFEAAVEGRTILLCVECLEGRRDQDIESFGAVCFSYREL